MTRKRKSPRELAARALCQHHGHPPDTKMDGQPMWASYLDEVDTVLKAALGEEAWRSLSAGPDTSE